MRLFFLILLVYVNVFTVVSQSSMIKKGTKKIEKYIKKYGDNLFVKQAAKKTISWSDEYVKKLELILKKTSKSAYKRKLVTNLTHNDLISKDALLKEIIDNNTLSNVSVQTLKELPLKSDLSKQLIDNLDNVELLDNFISDMSDEVFFDFINKHPYLSAYSKLQETSMRTNPKRLEWVENIQRWSNKKSNADKLKSRYAIKDFQIEEINGKRIYRDGDKVLAEERSENVFYAIAGKKNEKGFVEANNFLNQSLLPNSTYIVDDRYKYVIDDHGRVLKTEAELFLENRGRNADLQAIGRDTQSATVNTKIYQGGHVFAQKMYGPTELINILPQLRTQNLGGIWKAMETELMDAIRNGEKVILKVELEYNYPDNIELPSLYKISKIINGVEEYLEIAN